MRKVWDIAALSGRLMCIFNLKKALGIYVQDHEPTLWFVTLRNNRTLEPVTKFLQYNKKDKKENHGYFAGVNSQRSFNTSCPPKPS